MPDYKLEIDQREFRAIEARINQFPRAFRNKVSRAALQAVATKVAEQARATAPFVDNTGRLRRSIRAARRRLRRGTPKFRTLAVALAGNRRAPYAFFVERGIGPGSSSRTPLPFLLPALNAVQSQLIQVARRAAVARFRELEQELKRIRS